MTRILKKRKAESPLTPPFLEEATLTLNHEMKMRNNTQRGADDQRQKSDNLTLALDLAEAGIPVFACYAGGAKAKAPLTPNGFLDASTNEMQIRRWWRKDPDAVPGIPTGAESGFAVLDLDVKNGKDGVVALEAMGLDPQAVVEVRTAGGGWHLYFRHRPGLRSSADQIGQGVDVRGDGGYVIAPGAAMADGTRYEPVKGNLLHDADRLTAWPADLVPPEREAGAEEREPVGLSLNEARAMLDALPVDFGNTREEWRAVGMGLRHELGDDAFDIWDDWASQREGYGGQRDQMRQWRSFRADRAGEMVTIRSTMRVAAEAGWHRPAVLDSELPDLLAEFDDLTPEERVVLEGANDNRRKAGRAALTFTAPGDLTLATGRRPVIKGLLASGDVGCIVGQPGVGKSMIAPRLAWAVAQGRDVFGCGVRGGGVFYVAAEDEAGMRARMIALREREGDAPDLRLVSGVSDLLSKGSVHLKALREAAEHQRPALIIIDTLAMSFPGLEENSAEGMGRVVAAARSLTKWGAAVLLIHHDTKDGAQGLPRGHSLLNGALDVSLRLMRGDDLIIRGHLTKNRNGPCDLDLAFRIEVDVIGKDEDGEDVSAGVCAPLDSDAPRLPPLSRNERAALSSLREIVDGGGFANLDEWRRICVDGTECFASESRAARKTRFNECRTALVNKSRIEIKDDRVELLGFARATPEEFSDED